MAVCEENFLAKIILNNRHHDMPSQIAVNKH
jgi:hypothetical protein